jgi:hypothetical protein
MDRTSPELLESLKLRSMRCRQEIEEKVKMIIKEAVESHQKEA